MLYIFYVYVLLQIVLIFEIIERIGVLLDAHDAPVLVAPLAAGHGRRHEHGHTPVELGSHSAFES